jgi:hypothetical protein
MCTQSTAKRRRRQLKFSKPPKGNKASKVVSPFDSKVKKGKK